jgi:hypothetical protein
MAPHWSESVSLRCLDPKHPGVELDSPQILRRNATEARMERVEQDVIFEGQDGRGEALDGLIDRRLGQLSWRRAPVDEVLRLAEQYRSRYAGWTVKHFYSKYEAACGVRSYNFVRQSLQAAGPGLRRTRRTASATSR